MIKKFNKKKYTHLNEELWFLRMTSFPSESLVTITNKTDLHKNSNLQ